MAKKVFHIDIESKVADILEKPTRFKRAQAFYGGETGRLGSEILENGNHFAEVHRRKG